VKGTVTVRGTPLDGGDVHFNPSSTRRELGGRDAPIGKEGSFTVKTLLGPNVVTVTPQEAHQGPLRVGIRGRDRRRQVR
jgi:hypothetical protein